MNDSTWLRVPVSHAPVGPSLVVLVLPPPVAILNGRDQQLNTNGWISMIFEAKLPDVSEVDIFGILMLIDCPFLTWDLISTLISCQAAQPHDANAQSQLHLMTTKEKQLVTFLEMVMSQNYGTQRRNNWYIHMAHGWQIIHFWCLIIFESFCFNFESIF